MVGVVLLSVPNVLASVTNTTKRKGPMNTSTCGQDTKGEYNY